jgi:hypothetical protein
MAVDDPGEEVGQIADRVDIVQLTCIDQRGDGGPVFGAAIRACEQGIFPVERDGADGAFDGVVIELDATIVDKACQALPARQGVPDCVGEFALLTDKAKFFPQPWFKGIDQRLTFLLPDGATAGIFGPPGDEHPELRRHHVQPLAPVFADPVQFALAARQVLSSMSTTISIRGRCAGSAPRLIRRL